MARKADYFGTNVVRIAGRWRVQLLVVKVSGVDTSTKHGFGDVARSVL